MATTQSVIGINWLRGQQDSVSLAQLLEVVVRVSGTYATSGKPNVDLLAAIQSIAKQGATVLSAKVAIGANNVPNATYTYVSASNTTNVLSSTGGKLLTFRLDQGALDGTAGSEVAEGTDVSGDYKFYVVTTIA